MNTNARPRTATTLAAWMRSIDRAVDARAPVVAARMAEVILDQLPRHLPTYARMLDLCWQTQSWAEGDEWARRLLQADPGNSSAWRALAMSAEVEGQRSQANIIWRRAFEISPYDADIRVGVSRTSLDAAHALTYNLACLAAIRLSGRQWTMAAESFRTLVRADNRRVDFQVGLTLALWHAGETREAYVLARHLVQHHPNLLIAWRTLAETGDENDRALAENPLAMMDPDGEYVLTMWGIGQQQAVATIQASDEEMGLLNYRLPVRGETTQVREDGEVNTEANRTQTKQTQA